MKRALPALLLLAACASSDTETGGTDDVVPDTPPAPEVTDVPTVEDAPPVDVAPEIEDTPPPPDVPEIVAPEVVEDVEPPKPDVVDPPLVELDLETIPIVDGFPFGVAGGAVRHDSATLWTKWTGEGELQFRIWRDSEVEGQVLLAWEGTAEVIDGYAKVLAEGLEPDQVYTYAAFVPGGRSPAGQLVSALGEGQSRPLRFGATSCTKDYLKPWPALTMMGLGEPMDGFFHLGDMSYNDDAVTLDEYRDEWAITLDAQGYRDLLPATGFYVTWDDHEVTNNWNPETIDPERLEAATTAYFETLANEEGPDSRLWHSYRWGDAVEIFVLDSRSERKPSTKAEPDATYISQAQLEWLKEGLAASPSHFKVIFSSVPITDMPFWYLSEGDRWEGYAAQRTELLQFIEDQEITRVWFVAGDFHIGFVSRVGATEQDLGWGVREVAVGPGGNINPIGLLELPKPQFEFNHGDAQTATWLTFDPQADTVRVEFVSATFDGEVLHDVTYPGAP